MDKPCVKCGEVYKYIPDGVSKKTGKPYKAFFKCNSCGQSEWANNEPKPPTQGDRIEAKLEEISDLLDTLIHKNG